MKISVITVCFNSEKTIGDTLKSVCEQSYPDVEYIVVDGGSGDGTKELILAAGSKVSRYISEPDKGIYDAMNKGIALAGGDVVAILNSDDFYINNKVLEEVASIFSSDPTLDVVMGGVDFVSDFDLKKPLRIYGSTGFKPWMFRIGLMPPHPAAFIRKSAYEQIGKYKLGYKIAADFDLLVRLLSIGKKKYLTTEKRWVRMRAGGISTSSWRSNFVITQEMLRSLRENNLFSCVPMLLCRLPIKFFRQML